MGELDTRRSREFTLGLASGKSLHQAAPIRFTFLWVLTERWEGRDFVITVGNNPG